jgi:peptide/nickel transport system substrate-binding protein
VSRAALPFLSDPVRRQVLILILLVLLAGTGSTGVRGAPSLMIGTTEPLASLDPADAGDVFSWEVLTHLYTGLTRQIPGSLRYELALAAAHTISADGLTHTFAIKAGATFDDGTPIMARTFADSINRSRTLGGRGQAVVAPYIRSAAASDDNLILTLTAPVPYLEQLLALPPYFPVHPAIFPLDALNRTPNRLIANGVYRLGAFEAGHSITLVANPDSKGKTPATPTITIRHFDWPADLREALKAHQVDIAWRGLPLDDAENAEQVKGIRAVTAPGLQTFYLLIGQKQPPYDDPVIRQAMSHLLDRRKAMQIGSGGSVLYTLLPPELADAQAPAYPELDFDRASAILAQGSYSKFKRIESELQISRLLYGEFYADAADLFSSDLNRHEAIDTVLSDIEPKTFLDQIARGTFRLIVVGWTPVAPHPEAYLRPLLYSTGQLAAGAHYANPAVDQLLDQAALAADPQRQADLYDQAQALALQDVVVIPLWQSRQTLLAWDSISGITIEPNYLLRYDQLTVS